MRKQKLLVIIFDLLLLLSTLIVVPVTNWMMRFLTACPVATAGLQCPACGGTRCVQYFFKGRFAEAFAMNPFIFLLIPYLALTLIMLNGAYVFRIRFCDKALHIMTHWRTVIVLAIAFALFGILRNF